MATPAGRAIRISGFEYVAFRVSGFEYRVQGFEFHIRFRVSGFIYVLGFVFTGNAEECCVGRGT